MWPATWPTAWTSPCWPSCRSAWTWPGRWRAWLRADPAGTTGPSSGRAPNGPGPSGAGAGPVVDPEGVQAPLGAHHPDDAADDGDEQPERGEPADRRILALSGVEGADLGGHEERVHDEEQEGEQQSESSADAGARVVPHLLEADVLPVEGVDAERDDREPDHRPGVPRLADGAE